jgi:hypothetical protein
MSRREDGHEEGFFHFDMPSQESDQELLIGLSARAETSARCSVESFDQRVDAFVLGLHEFYDRWIQWAPAGVSFQREEDSIGVRKQGARDDPLT